VADGSRRTAILAAAKLEFGAHGYAGARIERIAGAARVNKQLLFHYFDSKDGLYIAAVSALLSDFQQPPPISASTPGEALKWMAAELVGRVTASPGLVRTLAECTRGSTVPDGASRQVSAWLAETAKSFCAIVVDGQKTGFFRDDVNPQNVASTVVAAAVGVSLIDSGVVDGMGDEARGMSSLATVIGQVVADYCAWR
jgi:TetR/AcrR family transcriptional regulator